MKHGLLLVLAIATAAPAMAQDTAYITPMKAIEAAAAAAPSGVVGIFDLTVRSTGVADGLTYLDSEADYRDQRNLAIDIPPPVQIELAAKYGPIQEYFQGKHIHVKGMARRVKITFLCNGKPTEKYYYQTHVMVVNPTQIEIVPETAPAPPVDR